MPSTQRRLKPSVEDRLLAEPYRFDFFQAVRLLELSLKSQSYNIDQVVANHIRFENSTLLSFPPSELESLRVEFEHDAADSSTSDEITFEDKPGNRRYYMTPSFMGFLGPNGTLPRHYSERIAAHQLYQRDRGPRAFLDTYSNRAVALFYGAWKKYRLEFDYELKGKNGFLPLLMSLSGLGHGALRDRISSDDIGVEDESLAFYSGALRHRPMSAIYLQNILSDYFRVDIKVEQFIGKWYNLPREHQTALGLSNAILDSSAIAGQQVWQRDLRVALKIGPLRKKDFVRFLPREVAARALAQMLKLFVGLTLEFEVQLILRGEDVGGCDLAEHRIGGLLGWDTFITTQEEKNDRSDVRYTLNAVEDQNSM